MARLPLILTPWRLPSHGKVLSTVARTLVWGTVCAAVLLSPWSPSAQAQSPPPSPIKHVIVVMMENHTFDNMFGRFPGANGVTLAAAQIQCRATITTPVPRRAPP